METELHCFLCGVPNGNTIESVLTQARVKGVAKPQRICRACYLHSTRVIAPIWVCQSCGEPTRYGPLCEADSKRLKCDEIYTPFGPACPVRMG